MCMFLRKKFDSIIFFIFIFLALTIKSYSFEEKGVISHGSQDSKVVVKVFSSLTCPHCADFHKNIFQKLKSEFIDRNLVKFEHHSFPLDLAALNAEKILRCPSNKEERLKLLDEIYDKQDFWASGTDINNINSKLLKIGKNYGLNNDKIKNCLNNEQLEEEILNLRINGSKKYSISSTPTILINENKYTGKQDYVSFKKAIEKFL